MAVFQRYQKTLASEKRNAAAFDANHDLDSACRDVLSMQRRANALCFAPELIEDPNTPEGVKEWLRQMLAFLAEHPTRGCTIGAHKALLRMQRAQRIQQRMTAAGLPLKKWSPKPRKKPWPKRPKAAFLYDSSLLPKRPPGK
jgi:hypothetical protein